MRGMTDLQVIQNYYEGHLCDRLFRYTLSNGAVIEITFYREAFCHLLGIQHVTKNRRYIGRTGYKRIQNGQLNIQQLKDMNRAGYAKIKHRIEFFTHTGHLMERGDIFRFYPERAGNTRIKATLLVHEKSQELYLHLFRARESPNSNAYAPMSYIVLTERDDAPMRCISGQEHKKVTAIDVLPMKLQA